MLAGCVSIADIDASKSEPGCARECTARYSSCIGSGSYVGALLQQSCKEGLQLCVKTCPPK